MRVLILGGTAEGYALGEELARDQRFAATYSLAGRTKLPRMPDVATRVGGFGGPDGLTAWLAAEGIEAVLDATHPYAARISANASAAAARLQLPLLRLSRPEWIAQAGDDWRYVASVDAAATALGPAPQCIFLTIGRSDIAVFRAAPWHRYVIRSVDAPDRADLPPDAEVILDRGPFTFEAELALMRAHGVDILVSKNSGGEAAFAKIAAARHLAIPVVMIARPPSSAGPVCADVASALQWLRARLTSAHAGPLSERGV